MLVLVKGGNGFDAVVSKRLGWKDIENVLSSYSCHGSQCKNLPRFIFCRFDLLNMVTLEVEIEELERIVAPDSSASYLD